MNFQIGDKVKIISLSKLEELSPKPWDDQYPFVSKEGCAFTEDMLDFCGLIGTIVNMHVVDGNPRYILSFDYIRDTGRSWVSDFFETRLVDSFEEV